MGFFMLFAPGPLARKGLVRKGLVHGSRPEIVRKRFFNEKGRRVSSRAQTLCISKQNIGPEVGQVTVLRQTLRNGPKSAENFSDFSGRSPENAFRS